MKLHTPTTTTTTTFFFIIIIFFTTTAAAAIPPPTTATNPLPPPSNNTNFIRTSCSSTLYPNLCFTSLSGYSSAVQQDPARLACVAIGVTLSQTITTAKFIHNISQYTDFHGGSPRAAAAVHDCLSVIGDAVDNLRGSLRQMRRLNGSGEGLRFQLSNVQTWMSAALTDEETCTDGFDDVADGGMKAEVGRRTVRVKEMTSNALALVNGFVNTIQVP